MRSGKPVWLPKLVAESVGGGGITRLGGLQIVGDLGLELGADDQVVDSLLGLKQVVGILDRIDDDRTQSLEGDDGVLDDF